jgi:hypothetical protein
MLKAYGDAWNTKSIDNTKVKNLTADLLAIQKNEVKMVESYVTKLNKVLPAPKIAPYLRLENKIRSILKFEAAGEIPLMPEK